ncbi:DNA-directed RNA polymerase subunit beta [Candidatus Poribacteria bacterium]|nr:DNA-directed RNA polymerase subunit beta [Candidatus Poribacteria bacterium]
MPHDIRVGKTVRRSYGKIPEVLDLPDLVEIQRRSYDDFLQRDVKPEERANVGLESVFREMLHAEDFSGTASIAYLSYDLGRPKYDINECQDRGMTYAIPLKVSVRLTIREKGKGDEERSIEEVRDSEVYMGEIPLMTERGTFIVNGAERVIVSQLHRSPGVIFKEDTQPSGRKTYTAQVIPIRGAWLEFESDVHSVLHVRLDKHKRRHASTFLRALGWVTDADIVGMFSAPDIESLYDSQDVDVSAAAEYVGRPLAAALVNEETGELYGESGAALTEEALAQAREDGLETVAVVGAPKADLSHLVGRVLAQSVLEDAEEGVTLAEVGVELDEGLVFNFLEAGVHSIALVSDQGSSWLTPVLNTLRKDPIKTQPDTTKMQEDALLEIYRTLQPGDSPTVDTAKQRVDRLYFDETRYDLSRVGRYKLNKKLEVDNDPTLRVLGRNDIVAALRYMLKVMAGEYFVDDVDHLGNRRVRAVGELLENTVRTGLHRMTRNIRERMTIQAQELDQKTANDLINPKPLVSAVKDFFGSSQLSQFMSRNNPLDELVHKRRITALGPGGLHRDRATYDARDVHHTHYGRICPIQTPEGPGVGLILYLSTYTRVNEYGFLETPYQRVENGKVVEGSIDYLTADQEDLHVIAQSDMAQEDRAEGDNRVFTRHRGNYMESPIENVAYTDVSPKQVVGISAALIPFLEHDDAVRALMGANYQGQAVPLLAPKSPIVGTGSEYKAALDSGAVVIAKRDGTVESVSADEVIVRTQDADLSHEGEHSFSDMGYDVYRLIKYKRSNSNTVIDQKPVVRRGQPLKAGDVIADGSATEKGELAVGANVVVAFMPWEGYNFEDAILISERLVRDDILTSIHIQEFSLEARDTKLGKEEITQDIPNKSEEALLNLDDEGVVQIGSCIDPWDILVGKVTPKGESELGPEEKLLRAIFGDKAGDFKDASLEARPGTSGVVIDTRVFARKERDRDHQSELREDAQVKVAEVMRQEREALINQGLREQTKRLVIGKGLAAPLRGEDGDVAARGDEITEEVADAAADINEAIVTDAATMDRIRQMRQLAQARIRSVADEKDERVEKIRKGDELKPGVLKLVKVYIATKRKISVGDKLSGRHGNKGVIAKILPIEDMPYLEDGTPVDMVLNPLGVPGRMNVGQILETHLGWAALQQDIKVATPVFDGATEQEIQDELEAAGLPASGKIKLYDGRSGEPFHQRVTVGVHYMLKLNHLVADKIHARSIGPYSLVTQQPLGGKAQLGGQRFGEMEVWALEAYGAAHLLQEILTIKSDDVTGRTRVYESIVKGENTPEPGTPESFNVLVKELQSLCLDVTLEEPDAPDGEDSYYPPPPQQSDQSRIFSD